VTGDAAMGTQRAFRVLIHHEDGSLWAEVPDVPGCFASGDTQDELLESLTEALSLCLGESLTFDRIEDVDRVDEHRVLLHA
jgi:predicted RNase H-like HicB family nuclease